MSPWTLARVARFAPFVLPIKHENMLDGWRDGVQALGMTIRDQLLSDIRALETLRSPPIEHVIDRWKIHLLELKRSKDVVVLCDATAGLLGYRDKLVRSLRRLASMPFAENAA